MLTHTAENASEAQPGTSPKVIPGHSWTVILMSVLSHTHKGVTSEYVTGAPGITGPSCLSGMGSGLEDPVLSLPPLRGPIPGLQWNARGVSRGFKPCHKLEPSDSHTASKKWAGPRLADTVM